MADELPPDPIVGVDSDEGITQAERDDRFKGGTFDRRYAPRQIWKGVVVNTDIRWRYLFIICVVLSCASAIVLVWTAQSMKHAVDLNRQVTCQNFALSHPELTTNKLCLQYVKGK